MAISPILGVSAALAPLAVRTLERIGASPPFAALLGGEQSRPAPADGSATEGAARAERVGEARRRLDEAAERLRRLVQQRAAEAGLQLQWPLELQFDLAGRVAVRGAHFQAAEAEQLLAANPELRSALRDVAQRFLELQRLAGDPESANRSLWDVVVELDAGAVRARFD